MQPPLTAFPGTAVFLNRGKTTAPLAMRSNVEHNRILHEHVVILSLETQQMPHVSDADRIEVDDLGYSDDGIVHVTARYGYMETPDIPDLLRRARKREPRAEPPGPRTRRTSCRPSSSASATGPACPAGASSSSWPPRASPPTRPTTSTCPATAP